MVKRGCEECCLADKHNEISSTGRVTWNFYGAGKRVFRKEANDSYLPYNEQGLSRLLPSLIIKRGYMAFLPRLRGEAAWWLVAPRGKVQAAIVIGVNRVRPEVVVEEWRADTDGDKGNMTSNGRSGAIRTQEVSMKLDEEGVCQVTGAPFTVRFHDLFLRDPANADEGNLVYAMEDLKTYASFVWMKQGFVKDLA